MISEKIMNETYKSIEIPCKPYVKRFMVQNFGDPINLYSVKNHHIILFRRCLENPCKRLDNKLAAVRQKRLEREKAEKIQLVNKMPEKMEIMISDYDFYNFGWEISPTDMVLLHSTFEQSAKLFMRTCISIDTSITGNQSRAIRRFQNAYNFPDSVWDYEAIKKDLDRNSPMNKIDFQSDIYCKIQSIIINILSNTGTLSPKNNLIHENNPKTSKQPRRHSQSLANTVLPDLFDTFHFNHGT